MCHESTFVIKKHEEACLCHCIPSSSFTCNHIKNGRGCLWSHYPKYRGHLIIGDFNLGAFQDLSSEFQSLWLLNSRVCS